MEKIYKECVLNDDLDFQTFFNCKFEDLIKALQDFQNKYSDYKNIRFIVYTSYDYVDFSIVGDRLETDEEFEKRKEKALAHQASKEQKRQKRIELLERELKNLKGQ